MSQSQTEQVAYSKCAPNWKGGWERFIAPIKRGKGKSNGNISNQHRGVIMLVGYSAKLDSFILQIRYILQQQLSMMDVHLQI
jgi:hypothetical protein